LAVGNVISMSSRSAGSTTWVVPRCLGVQDPVVDSIRIWNRSPRGWREKASAVVTTRFRTRAYQ
jgi:hypothetical protein